MVLAPRPYQQRGVDDVHDAFAEGHTSICYVLPTGAGKTIVFTMMAELAATAGTRTCIIVHRDNLLRQAAVKLHDCGISYSLIAPGRHYYGDRVAVASKDTLVRRLGRYPFEFIVTDEGHHGVSDSYQKIYRSYPEAHLLFVTATPERLDGRGLKEVCSKLVLGPSIADLIADGYLIEPIPYGPKRALDLSGVRTSMGEYNLRELADAMDRRQITGDALEHYRDLCPGAPAIAFCVSIKHAEDVAAEFAAAGFRAADVHSKMPQSEIWRRIGGLSDGSVQVLTSCDLISEGTDVPRVSAIIGLRPTQSRAVYLQQIGRGLRPVYTPGIDLSSRAGRLAAIAQSEKPRCLVIDHAGNTFRFGSADEERDWSLDGRPKRGSSGVAGIAIRQCPKCFICHKPAPVCPACGHVYIAEAREPEQVDGRLAPIDKAALKRARTEMIRGAGSYSDLKDVARRLGYHPTWAYRIAIQRGYRL